MNKNYVSPHAEIKNFMCENVIAASGVNNNPLKNKAMKEFSVSDADVSWKSKVN